MVGAKRNIQWECNNCHKLHEYSDDAEECCEEDDAIVEDSEHSPQHSSTPSVSLQKDSNRDGEKSDEPTSPVGVKLEDSAPILSSEGIKSESHIKFPEPEQDAPSDEQEIKKEIDKDYE